VRRNHGEKAGADEPLTKIIDELVYDESIRKKAVAAVGGREQAFKVPIAWE
jgi:hypothetical protein